VRADADPDRTTSVAPDERVAGAPGIPYAAAYAGIYDAVYAEKDYERECDLVEEAFRRFAGGPVRSVLDLGCGTGGHALRLAARGYDVAGVDRSADMVAIAREKAARDGLPADLSVGDLRDVRLGRRFEAVLLMFAVLGYQTANADVAAALATVRAHLDPGGLALLDCWYGPGVLTDPPGSGTRTVQTAAGPVERRVTGELDTRRHLCTVRYELSGPLPDGRRDAVEVHTVRYFFPLELELFLERAGLELLSLAPVGTLDGEPTTETWNVAAVARAV
jgi:SAM-dependent methyltransferase